MGSNPQYSAIAAQTHPVPHALAACLAQLSAAAREAERQFPMRLPSALAQRIPWRDDDPLTRQFLPSGEELLGAPGDSLDPLNERQAMILPGLIGKYAGRVLLKVTEQCAVHCRFCFRRHSRDVAMPQKPRLWRPIMDWIAQDSTLHEVILSGGDPLTWSDRRLGRLIQALAALAHVTRLRVHTRMPVVTPERITPALLATLRGSRLTPWVVVHVNHRQELDQQAVKALGRLVDGGVPVLSQSVLLRGVNDDLATLVSLFGFLIDLRIIPYYLHMLDPVIGTAHFRVAEQAAQELMMGLQVRLPGYAVPRLVREDPEFPYKRWLVQQNGIG
ncbi:MAG: KamA family radical SAM protein [Magnetococcales bacterium]|nr:KamA family radical SAM protein [Magnetococcales bacterium]NGZ06507.1 KamA family radical SAM protein [Magnetococcales bacterium]